METELEPQRALQGLAVLSAIPLVLFALWADYFGRALKTQMAEDRAFEPAAEMYRIRLTGLFALLAQLMLFFGSADVRQVYPHWCNLMFVGAVLGQMLLQSFTERRLAPLAISKTGAAPGPEPIGVAFRAFMWSVIGGLIYIGVMMVSLWVFGAISVLTQASGGFAVVLMVIGAVVGVIAGLALGFAMGPFQLRRMLPTYAMEESSARAAVESCFSRQGLPVPAIWIVGVAGPQTPENSLPQFTNAMVAGFPSGRGIFRPALFLARSLVDTLDTEELQAVVLHEISHIRLAHLRKRFVLASGMIVGTSLLAGMAIILAQFINPGSAFNAPFSFAALLVAFVATFRALMTQNRLHEIEADLEAARMGASVPSLCQALRKLDHLNHRGNPNPGNRPTAPTMSGSGHPTTEERIWILQAYQAKQAEKPTAEPAPTDKAA